MKKAVIPGSYDPITKGHVDMIERAAALFDEVVVAVVDNPDKRTMFTLEEREAFAREACERFPNVTVKAFAGLLIDFSRENGVTAVVRGVRNARDFDYEYGLSQIYRMTGELETLFLPSSGPNAHVSSTMVRELLKNGKDPKDFIPFTLK